MCFKADMKVTQKSFNFAKKQGLPFYFVSAADGTNVVKVRMNIRKNNAFKMLNLKKDDMDFVWCDEFESAYFCYILSSAVFNIILFSFVFSVKVNCKLSE